MSQSIADSWRNGAAKALERQSAGTRRSRARRVVSSTTER